MLPMSWRPLSWLEVASVVVVALSAVSTIGGGSIRRLCVRMGGVVSFFADEDEFADWQLVVTARNDEMTRRFDMICAWKIVFILECGFFSFGSLNRHIRRGELLMNIVTICLIDRIGSWSCLLLCQLLLVVNSRTQTLIARIDFSILSVLSFVSQVPLS